MKDVRFVELGSTTLGTAWVNPELINGYAIQQTELEGGRKRFTGVLHVGMAAWSLVNPETGKTVWPDHESVHKAVEDLLAPQPPHTALRDADPRVGDVYAILDGQWEVVELIPDAGDHQARARRTDTDPAPGPSREVTLPLAFLRACPLIQSTPET